MPIPQFNNFGFLEVGTHICTITEIENHYLTNDHRKSLWKQFFPFFTYIREMNCFEAVEFYGSFFHSKELPGDIDVALEFTAEDKSSNVDPLVFDKAYFKANHNTDVVIKEPATSAYRAIASAAFTFTTPSLYLYRRLKREEWAPIAKVLRKPAYEFAQDEFKGVLRVLP
jgi:hypothetical protein